ncbi:MAG: carboxypeptidase M32 [Culicoidibacterales bacterium]
MIDWNNLKQKMDRLNALKHAENIIAYDMETGAPSKSLAKIGNTLETLARIYHEEMTQSGLEEMLVEAQGTELTSNQQKMVEVLLRDVKKLTKIPVAEYASYNQLLIVSHGKWIEARNANDFSIFAPTLQEVINFQKKYINYQGYEGNKYNALLDDYEPNLTVSELDGFFADVKEKLVPFLQILLKNEEMQAIKDAKIGAGYFPKEKQMEFMRFLASYAGYDFQRGKLDESAHPFSMSFSNDDARITTRYDLTDICSSIFSVLHEFGHAVYELNIAEELTQTPLGTGVSMGIHESQSRFYENIIGRTKSFWKPIYPVLQAFFPNEYGLVSLDDFILHINAVSPSFIRVEADELTYPLHIMVRYDLEKMIFNDEITVEQLPEAWNQKMVEYLGITPQTLGEGMLQDIHWSQGLFGYFPTYALGSAYSAQFYQTMLKSVDVDFCLLEGDLTPITAFLAENIHQYGKAKTPKELIRDTTGEAFNSKYYTEYLINKYTAIFNKA